MVIRGGLIALPGESAPVRADLFITDGRITRIERRTQPDATVGIEREPGDHAPSPQDDQDIVDARGLLVLPGGVDPHVHFDEPGYTDREDFLHGSSASASGGVTTVIDMPCTSVPPVTSVANLETKLAAIGGHAVIDFGLYGGISARSGVQELLRIRNGYLHPR
jgi:dihydroorotase-like cyclic amidohydrolase